MPPSTSAQGIVAELEVALRDGSEDKRNAMLQRVTDLFLNGATRYSESDAGVFDEVMGHLISHVESRALVELSARLAPVANAPLHTMRRLARNDAIDISGPVLAQSNRLNDDDLVAIAKTKSQAHLASIAQRPEINEAVTEALVDNGNADVANAVAANAGARLSNMTLDKLIMRADGDERLTGAIARRSDLPRSAFRHLMAQATELVRARLLEMAAPAQKAVVQQVLDEISVQVGNRKGPPPNYAEAQRIVAGFSQDTELTRSKLMSFAVGKRIAEMVAALSVLSALPVNQVYQLYNAPSTFGLMALCKALLLDWPATCAVMAARSSGLESKDTSFEDLRAQYEAFSPASAQRTIRYWQSRQSARVAAA